MFRKLLFQTRWRLAVSAIPLFILIGGTVIYEAVERSRGDLARYLDWTPEKERSCADAGAKGLFLDSQVLAWRCEKPTKPTGILDYIFRDFLTAFATWIAFSVSIFLILTSISLYISENVTGWKRLSIVVASGLTLISFLVTLISWSSFYGDDAGFALLFSCTAFPMGVLLVLGGRRIAKWVQAGFISDPAEPISQSSPELKSDYTSPEESPAPQKTSTSAGRLITSQNRSKKIFATSGVIIAALIAIVIGKGIGKGVGNTVSEYIFWPKAVQFSEGMLVSLSNEVNKQLPMMADTETRLDTTRGGPGRKYTYYYTLVNNASDSLNSRQLQAALTPSVKKEACGNTKFQMFFENGVVFTYSYSGNDGRLITQIDVHPSDCGYRQ